MMLSKLDSAPNMQIRKLRETFGSPSKAAADLRKVIDNQLDTAPLRLVNTATGLLSDREAQINFFKQSTEYNELLLSSIMKHQDFPPERIAKVVAKYFRYAMLSHRWEGKEPVLEDIQDKDVYKLNQVGGIMKLQSFCNTARDAGYLWAWSDTCCIKKSDPAEFETSIKSMFIWYHHSALTIVYLSDVSSESGALADSVWNERGWTVQEFLAPHAILFYCNNWTLYLDDRTPNHKESDNIMRELERATGIDRRVIQAFSPGTRDARKKLQWASKRATTVEEDIAYSLYGIFDVRLVGLDYGEKKQHALGRLLREIIAQSGDITALDWIGTSSVFNSCLPADISSYEFPPCAQPSVSEDEIKSSLSSLRGIVAPESALKLYQTLDRLSTPRFAHRRLLLPCIVFPVTEASRRPGQDHDTYEVKADGIHDLHITIKDKFIPFSQARPPPTWQTLLLVRPWSRDLLGLPNLGELLDVGDDTQNEDNLWSSSEASGGFAREDQQVVSESSEQAFRLLVRLGQRFGAFLLARQGGGEYKRIASDRDIMAQIKDMASVVNTMDIRTIEIS
ncbi:uncharacterized protein EDB91DRAFT_1350176 [Suillus paluster]|uniref:uncharacterized protein n=1 Tax=Suillus paluster TaxID=48578 RepID=UPI001B881E60|nr:uncharacterized protein EDB91DRAFT_1350176 [Suillus paluster]KAG1728160.1 hypothetical protein EDB91DRAFT_1350176 [Suillus paluster]